MSESLLNLLTGSLQEGLHVSTSSIATRTFDDPVDKAESANQPVNTAIQRPSPVKEKWSTWPAP
jgi:hypothetical protein